jgi:signal transduction histidine kinase
VNKILPGFFVLSTSAGNAIISQVQFLAPMFEQISSLLSTLEGELIYSLLLGLLALSALISCLYAIGRRESAEGQRLQIGLLLLFLAQIILFGVTWLAWIGVFEAHSILPALDRSLLFFSLVMIIWMWAFPQFNKLADTLFAIAQVIIIIVAGVGGSSLWLILAPDGSFNSSLLAGYTYYAGLGIVIIGLIILIARKPKNWGYGALMVLIIGAGYAGQFLMGQPDADFSGFIHLGEMIGFLLLLALPVHLVDSHQVEKASKFPHMPEMALLKGGSGVIKSIVNLLTETSPQQYYQQLTEVVALLMDADACILIMPPKAGEQLLVPVGYNRQEARVIEGFAADAQKMPAISKAITDNKTLFLVESHSPKEIQVLADELGMKRATQLMLVPFHPKTTNVIMALVVLSQSQFLQWIETDSQKLSEITDYLVSQAGQLAMGAGQKAGQVEMEQKLQRAEAYADQVRLEYAQLKAKYDSVSTDVTKSAAQAASVAELKESQKRLQEKVGHLEARNHELETLLVSGRPTMEEVDQLRQELRSALEDLARIPSALSKSDQKMLETQLTTVKHLDDLQPTELVNSIAQEFRQPLASILGYTDLLLGESVGILGAMQKKFLERVKASTERLGILLSELVQVVSIDGGLVDQTLVSVDLKTIIDEATANFEAQLGEKNIIMQIDIPQIPPVIRVNKDALLQILANLLENACLVTPSDGLINLAAKVERRENSLSYILISVTDQGGGVAKADLPRVFQRRYKDKNPQIKGIGDTGVGLSIVKSLVELYKGRVWVDTQQGDGSTFSVLLPLIEDQPNQEKAASKPG